MKRKRQPCSYKPKTSKAFKKIELIFTDVIEAIRFQIATRGSKCAKAKKRPWELVGVSNRTWYRWLTKKGMARSS